MSRIRLCFLFLIRFYVFPMLPKTATIQPTVCDEKENFLWRFYHSCPCFTRKKLQDRAFFKYRSWRAMQMPTKVFTPLAPLAIWFPQAEMEV